MSLYFIPFIAAFIGWFVNWFTIKLLFHPQKPVLGIQGIFPKRRQQLVKQLAAQISEQFDDIRNNLKDPESIKAIIPVVEGYMDIFLKEKLPAAMPVFKMFIGESTTNQVKAVLMTELDHMLPLIIDQYLQNKAFDFEQLIDQKLDAKTIERYISKELRPIQLAGAIIGFIIGLAELFILHSCHSS
jgi:uncharacterized membrane protein YheB (UPF0754 family)